MRACLILMLMVFTNLPCQAAETTCIIVEDFWGGRVVSSLARSLPPSDKAKIYLEVDVVDLQRFIGCKAQIVALRAYPLEDERRWIYGFRANKISKTAYMVGQAKVLAVVNTDNLIKDVNYEQLQRILGKDGQNATWLALNGRRVAWPVWGAMQRRKVTRPVFAE